MERAQAFHTIMVEMTTGMLVLATLAILVCVWVSLLGGDRYQRLGDYADSTALFGAAVGLPMIALAIITGFQQWPLEAFLNSVIARNKIFTAIVAFGFWAAFLLVRLAAGRRLWVSKPLALYALAMGLGGFAYLVFTASIGGDLSGKPSGFEQLARTFVETRRTFLLPAAASVLLIAVGVALPLMAFFWSKKKSV